MKFAIHDVNSAPAAARDTLQQIASRYGFVPNLAGVFAESPAALQGLLGALSAYDNPALELSELERQVVLLAVSASNRCAYCTAAHGLLAHSAGLAREQVEKLQQGEALDDPRLRALQQFAEELVQRQGWPGEERLAAFTAAGYGQAHALEVVFGVALKTLTNYANHLAQPPVNAEFAGFLPRWAQAAA